MTQGLAIDYGRLALASVYPQLALTAQINLLLLIHIFAA